MLGRKSSRVIGSWTLAALLAVPACGVSQSAAERHRRAVASQRAHDHQHHTGAKVVGGSAVGGAVIGGLAGGGKGALIGGALGAGGGAIANHVRVKKGERARERSEPR